MFSSIEDLAHWDQNFYQPIVGDTALIAQVLTPGRIASGRPIHYAFGLFVQNYADLPIISHAGIFAGFTIIKAAVSPNITLGLPTKAGVGASAAVNFGKVSLAVTGTFL